MKTTKRPNPVAKDLRTSKYKMRVVQSKKKYCRKQEYRVNQWGSMV